MNPRSLGRDIELGIEGFALFSSVRPSQLAWSLNQVHEFSFERQGDLILQSENQKHYCAKFGFIWDWFDCELRLLRNLRDKPILKTNIHADYILVIMDGESEKAAQYIEHHTHNLQFINGMKRLDPKLIRKLVAYL